LREADEQTVADTDLSDDALVDADFCAGDALEEDSHGEEVYDDRGESRKPSAELSYLTELATTCPRN